ncbi:hypothetical protein RhiirA4_483761 [Rhizophagus irregularis]|uniref:Uncharacterized protein n=1 Tax=Rhizophagus irregularis TaxID=588596 RepID=A0A2I1HMY7_9GLOM|nr:hypothetical protein RhiirA4_483761 [Rhizophagus irregularis]
MTLENLINWEITQDWLKPFTCPTSMNYSQLVSWKVKSLTAAPETNEHLWTCPSILPTLQSIFHKTF